MSRTDFDGIEAPLIINGRTSYHHRCVVWVQIKLQGEIQDKSRFSPTNTVHSVFNREKVIEQSSKDQFSIFLECYSILITRSHIHASETLFLHPSRTQQVFKAIKIYVYKVNGFSIRQLDVIHASWIKTFFENIISMVAILSHVMQSETGMSYLFYSVWKILLMVFNSNFSEGAGDKDRDWTNPWRMQRRPANIRQIARAQVLYSRSRHLCPLRTHFL